MTRPTRAAGAEGARVPAGDPGDPRPAPPPRPATPQDVPEILRLIRELAAYEHSLHEVVATEELLARLLFDATPSGAGEPAGGDRPEADGRERPGHVPPVGTVGVGPRPGPGAFCHVVDAPGQPEGAGSPVLAGFALWFTNASTWLARPGIYLEDLYVSPAYRGLGVGRTLMATLAALCVERGYGRLEWWVLDWNRPAIDFYRSLGAQPMDQWTVHRLTGAALAALADSVALRVDEPPNRR